jgi:hypothetical protein
MRLRAFVRRTVAYNLQPRKLALLPFSLAATGIAVYALWTGSNNTTLVFVMIGLLGFVTVVDAVWWLALRLLRPGSPNQF